MTRPLAASFLIFSLVVAGCSALIEWGGDEPDQAFLKTHIAAMERKPFDGVVLHLTVPGVPPHLANFSWHLADYRYQWDELRPAVEELGAVPFHRFQHNLLRVNLNPTDRPLDLLVTECAHFSLESLFETLRGKPIRRVALTHLHRQLWAKKEELPAMAKEYGLAEKLTIARDGMKLEF